MTAERKRRSWWLLKENYDALFDEGARRGLSDNAMINEIVREWRQYVAATKLHQFDAKRVLPPTT